MNYHDILHLAKGPSHFLKFILLVSLFHFRGYMYHSMHGDIFEELVRIGSIFPPCRLQGIEIKLLGLMVSTLLTEPSH